LPENNNFMAQKSLLQTLNLVRTLSMRIQYGSIVTDGIGKLGGHVYSKNKGSAYVRTKTKPTNPRTVSQVAQRNRNTTNAQGWRGLTASQILAWNALAAITAKKNKFGSTHFDSGFQLYTQLNNNLATLGLSPISAAPAFIAVTALTSFSFTATHVAGVVTLTFAPAASASVSFVFRATPQYGNGKTFIRGAYRVCGVLVTADASPYIATAMYNSVFPAITAAGQKISASLTPIMITTGQKGLPLAATVVVA
jgi:hypothetical protein